jgi:ABC-type Fe3+ transport system permease subunit
MSLQEVFLIVGIACFAIWLIIAFLLAIFIISFARKVKHSVNRVKNQSKPIKIALSLARSALFRKALLFAGSTAFISQAVSSLFSSDSDEE